jgi:hypothetical protein
MGIVACGVGNLVEGYKLVPARFPFTKTMLDLYHIVKPSIKHPEGSDRVITYKGADEGDGRK